MFFPDHKQAVFFCMDNAHLLDFRYHSGEPGDEISRSISLITS